MANRVRGQRKVEVDGKIYTLWYTVNALAELEDALDEPLMQLADKFTGGKAGFRELRNFIWAGLVEKQPEITLREAGSVMDAVGFTEAVNVAMEAFTEAFPQAGEGQEKKEGKPEASGTGES